MKARLLLVLMMLIALALPLASASWAVEVPYLSGRIVDSADFFDSTEEEELERRLVALESAGAQMAVLTVPDLQGVPVEDFAIRVAETWQLGQRGVDNGILLVISRSERALRLEVGYGLEDQLTDAASRRILDRVVTPAFRASDFAGGVGAAIDTIQSLLDGEEVTVLSEEPSDEMSLPGCVTLLFFWLMVMTVIRAIGRVLSGRRGKGWSSNGGWLPPIVISGGGGRSGGFSGGFSGGGGSFGGGGASGGW